MIPWEALVEEELWVSLWNLYGSLSESLPTSQSDTEGLLHWWSPGGVLASSKGLVVR